MGRAQAGSQLPGQTPPSRFANPWHPSWASFESRLARSGFQRVSETVPEEPEVVLRAGNDAGGKNTWVQSLNNG